MVSLEKLRKIFEEEDGTLETKLLAVYDFAWNEGFTRAETIAWEALKTVGVERPPRA